MTPDEVRLLDNELALLFIRGERPIMDRKFEITKHSNVCMTPDGEDPTLEYHHGDVKEAVAFISLTNNDAVTEIKTDETFIFLTDEED